MKKKLFIFVLFLPLLNHYLIAQDKYTISKYYMFEAYPQLREIKETDWKITDEVYTRHNGLTHIYLRQIYRDIEIFNANMNFTFRDGQILHAEGLTIPQFDSKKLKNTTPKLTPEQALQTLAQLLGLEITENISIEKKSADASQKTLLSKAGISAQPIPVELVYFANDRQELILCWKLQIDEISEENYWEILIDAQNGNLVKKNNWVLHCQFDSPAHHHSMEENCYDEPLERNLLHHFQRPTNGEKYNVFAFPVESPNHGVRTLEIDPHDNEASPFGWLDENGTAGADNQITKGNNVNAYEDRNITNSAGYSPNGGTGLNFDFPINLSGGYDDYLDASIVNLFYANNRTHDILYHYGFDEVAGNFQRNNYGKGGTGNDAVRAEAQDGSGLNNANFATPPEGSAPRMQMFLWGAPKNLTINTPSTIAGTYEAPTASFGASIRTIAVEGNLVLAQDGSLNPTLACETITNTSALAGKIAVVDRGNCNFTVKVKNAQNAGAIAVIIINNVSGNPFTPGGTDNSITIPSVMISQTLGNEIKSLLSSGETIQVKLLERRDLPGLRDSSFDNGIIVHEYGHGVSNRLTGGPSTTSCLGNAEQMGEGWSDYFGLMLTMKATDTRTTARGIGTYAANQATSGVGIRPARYSTELSVNSFTYSNISQSGFTFDASTNDVFVHSVGFLFCNMLWEMTWNLIDAYGFDSDLAKGNGGNNIALQLVMDGLKLQPCSPGFIDARNAILLADKINNNGENQELIWTAFAKRGLGVAATQGNANSLTDNEASFNPPNSFNCSANAGFITPPSSASLPIALSQTQTLGTFSNSFNTTTEPNPGSDYETFYLLTNNAAPFTIRSKSADGNLSINGLAQGEYRVWIFSYRKTNSLGSAVFYLNNKTNIQQIQDDMNIALICADLDNRYADGSVATVKIDNVLAIEPISKLTSVQYYPNPSSGTLSLSVKGETQKNLKMTILNVQGVEVLSKEYWIDQVDFRKEIQLERLSSGLYLIKMELNGKLYVGKLILR